MACSCGGKQRVRAVPMEGHVEIELEDMRLDFNDGVNLRFLAPGQAEPKRHQLYLAFDDGSALVGGACRCMGRFRRSAQGQTITRVTCGAERHAAGGRIRCGLFPVASSQRRPEKDFRQGIPCDGAANPGLGTGC